MKKIKALVILGKQIRTLRVEREYSQEELADAAGLDRAYVSRVERGVANISILKLLQIARTLKVSLSDIVKTYDKTK